MPTGGFGFSFEDRAVRKILRKARSRMDNMRPVFVDIGEYMLISTDDNFRQERDPDGRAWKPVKDETLLAHIGGSKSQKKRGGTKLSAIRKLSRIKILTGRGRLRGSIIYSASNKGVSYGTNVKYAAAHQFGVKTRAHTIRPRRKKALFWAGAGHPVRVVHHPGSDIPARPFLGMGRRDRQEILTITGRHIQRDLRA